MTLITAYGSIKPKNGIECRDKKIEVSEGSRDSKESRTNHLVDELELVLSLLDQLLHLPASDFVLDALPVVLLLTDLEPVLGEGLNGFAVALVLGDGLDLLERARVEPDKHLPRVGHHVEAHDTRRLLHSASRLQCRKSAPAGQDPPEEHRAVVACGGGGVSLTRLRGTRETDGLGAVGDGKCNRWAVGFQLLLTRFCGS